MSLFDAVKVPLQGEMRGEKPTLEGLLFFLFAVVLKKISERGRVFLPHNPSVPNYK